MEFLVKKKKKRGDSTVLIQNFHRYLWCWLQYSPTKAHYFLSLSETVPFVLLTPSALSPPTGGCLVLSQKKISFVTWLKWQTKIPSPSCSTDPLFPGRLGWARRQQWGWGGGGPLGQFQPLTLGQLFFSFVLVLLFIFVAPETFTSQVKRNDECVITVAAEDTGTSWGRRHTKWRKHFLHTQKILLHSSYTHVLPLHAHI